MKTKIILTSFLAIVLGMSSCKKEKITQEEIVKEIGAAVILNPSDAPTFELTPGNDDGAFERIVWEAAYYGDDVTDITYHVEFDLVSGDYSNAIKLTETEDLFSVLTVSEANNMFRTLGVVPSVETTVKLRVVSTVGSDVKTSEDALMSVKRYIYDDEVIVWGLTGSSVEEDHVALSYNESEDLWKGVVQLKAGTFLFKDRSVLQTTLGSDGTVDGLVEGGSEIATVEGLYVIQLDLTNKKYVLINPPANLYLVGSHNGWDNSTASAHKNLNNGSYEVYQYNDAAFECKWLPQLGAWDGDLGNDPDNYGNLIEDGEQNVSISEAGLWYIKADLVTATWTATKTTWGIIGDSTPEGWGAQTDFTDFDATTNTFTMEATLIGGKELKFRGTDDWSLNYGGAGLSGEPLAGGANIAIPDDGTYDITLTLGHGGNYSYSIVKK